jgi:hypothetical protein
MSYEHFERDDIKTELEKADLEASKALIALIDSVDKEGEMVKTKEKHQAFSEKTRVKIDSDRKYIASLRMASTMLVNYNKHSRQIDILLTQQEDINKNNLKDAKKEITGNIIKIKGAIAVADKATEAYNAIAKGGPDSQKKLKLILVNAKKKQKSEVNEFISGVERIQSALQKAEDDDFFYEKKIRDLKKSQPVWNSFNRVMSRMALVAYNDTVRRLNFAKTGKDAAILLIKEQKVDMVKQIKNSKLPGVTALAEKKYNDDVARTESAVTIKATVANTEPDFNNAVTVAQVYNNAVDENDTKNEQVTSGFLTELAKENFKQRTGVLVDDKRKGKKKTIGIVLGVVGGLLVALVIAYMLVKRYKTRM